MLPGILPYFCLTGSFNLIFSQIPFRHIVTVVMTVNQTLTFDTTCFTLGLSSMLWELALQLGRLDPLPPSSCWLGVTIQESVNHFVRTKASQRPGMTSWATSSPQPLLPTKRRESQVSLHLTPLLYSCAVLLRLPCGSENQACQHIPVCVSFQTGQNSVTFHSALTNICSEMYTQK